ncbi:MAG: hypothetical protein ACI89J_003698 [Hyphomicrobiaceae bacterium]|jgi:uncharacterized protein YcbK (DUF882 family)
MLLNGSVRPVVLFIVIATALQLTGASRAEAALGCLSGSLKSMLRQIETRFGNVRVISTFRKNARIAGSVRRSYHASCRAVDFHPPKGKYSAVVGYLKRNFNGGIGTYHCNMHHIHIDNGPRTRWRKCQ